jgi:hypothetical protein
MAQTPLLETGISPLIAIIGSYFHSCPPSFVLVSRSAPSMMCKANALQFMASLSPSSDALIDDRSSSGIFLLELINEQLVAVVLRHLYK